MENDLQTCKDRLADCREKNESLKWKLSLAEVAATETEEALAEMRIPTPPEDLYVNYSEGTDVEFYVYFDTSNNKLTEIYYKNLSDEPVRVTVNREPEPDIVRDLPANTDAQQFRPASTIAPTLINVVGINVEHPPPLTATNRR